MVGYSTRNAVSGDAQFGASPEFTGYLSTLGLDGRIQDLDGSPTSAAPTGMGISDDKHSALERGYLTEIDIDRGECSSATRFSALTS